MHSTLQMQFLQQAKIVSTSLNCYKLVLFWKMNWVFQQ